MNSQECLAHLKTGGYLKLVLDSDGANLAHTLSFVRRLALKGEIGLLASDITDREGRYLWVWSRDSPAPDIVRLLNSGETIT